MSKLTRWLRESSPLRYRYRLPAAVTVGRHTYGLTRQKVFSVSANAPLKVGAFCSIARGVSFICSGGNHPIDAATTFPVYSRLMSQADPAENGGRPCGITIGNDVWIGQGATIMPGVAIGDGAVIGTGAIVTKDIPPYAIVGGSPAKIIRYRFFEDTVSKLQAIQWWQWDDEKIKREAAVLTGPVEVFIERHSKAN